MKDSNKVVIARYPRYRFFGNHNPVVLEGKVVERGAEHIKVTVDNNQSILFKKGESSTRSLTHIYKMFNSVYEFNAYTDLLNETYEQLDGLAGLMTTMDLEGVNQLKKGVDDLIVYYI